MLNLPDGTEMPLGKDCRTARATIRTLSAAEFPG